MTNSKLTPYFLLLSGALLGSAWLVPLSYLGAVLGCISFFILLASIQSISLINKKTYWLIWAAGCLSHAIAFYWIFGTIKNFGHFPAFGALLVFLLFITLSTLQFPLFIFLRSSLPQALDKFALRSPIAWITIELLAVRIFPWSAAHHLSAVPALTQLAEFGGVSLVAFIFIWICECLAFSYRQKHIYLGVVACVASILIHISGSIQINTLEKTLTKSIPVALIQGNIPLDQKHNHNLSAQNIQQYTDDSKAYDNPGNLIVWPETVMMEWIREDIGHNQLDRRLPKLANGASLIFGSLAYRSKTELYNSAFAIGADGKMPLPYHKRILMPFGEFTPFGDTFPFLRELNNTAGDFSEGAGQPTIKIPLNQNGRTEILATPLICYEDVLPRIANQGAAAGAEILINLTNDAWFGESAAPYQHHQIALFRSIETRRSLIRATNTGLSAIVDPTGITRTKLAPFVRTSALSTALLNSSVTYYSFYPIQSLWLLFACLTSCLSILRFLTIDKTGGGS